MRKVAISLAIVFIAIIAGEILISRKLSREENHTSSSLKIGVILNGSANDFSWGQALVEGLEITSSSIDMKITYIENVPADTRCIEAIENLITAGCKVIICNSSGYEKYEMEVAEKHKEIYFFNASGTEHAENFTSYSGRIYQMHYLSGLVAGLQTETGKIGFISSVPNAEVNRGINAFTLGVRKVNPNASVYVRFCGTWEDDELTKKHTESLISSCPKIDVLAIHTDSLSPLEVAEERGIWSIGYNRDNSKIFPKTWLTAPVWKWDSFYTEHIEKYLHGSLKGQHYWSGVESDVIALTPLTSNVKNPEANKLISEELSKLQSGTFDVFYGPIKDNSGKIRVHEGENLPDSSLLNNFDWYVEGVIINAD